MPEGDDEESLLNNEKQVYKTDREMGVELQKQLDKIDDSLVKLNQVRAGYGFQREFALSSDNSFDKMIGQKQSFHNKNMEMIN